MNELDWREADEAFARMHGSGGFSGPHLTVIYLLCGDGILNVYKDTTDEVLSPERASEHNVMSNKSSAQESVRHVNYKILACRYLNQNGHSLETERVEKYTETGFDWCWDCFEESVGNEVVDVACNCDDHTTGAEVGYVSPKQVLAAFGYTILGKMTDAEVIQENLTRVHRSDLNTIVPIPYNQDPDTDLSVYVFEATSELPEADPTRLRDAVDEALYGDE